jgi:23S rRNA (guanosine2251-2'-O)-methyltransferase
MKGAPKRGKGSKSSAPKLPKAGPSKQDWILGYNSVRAALMARPQDCRQLCLTQPLPRSHKFNEILRLASDLGLEIKVISRQTLDGFGDRHQGMALTALPKTEPSLSEILASCPASDPALIVFLDHLEDPHNFGALIRSAAAFGALAVVYPKDRSAPLNQAARMASAGASEVIPLIKVVNPVRAVMEMKKNGFWVVAAEVEAETDALGFDYPERTALLLGSEGAGLRPSLLAQADFKIRVDLFSPYINSLNVSNAGAILAHAYRASQARKKSKI